MSDEEIGQLNDLLGRLELDGDTESPFGTQFLSDTDVILGRHERANQMIAEFVVKHPSKTLSIGIPESQIQRPMRTSVSGWRSWAYDLPDFHHLDQETALVAVGRLSHLINHPTLSSDFDQGRPGRFFSCHAEKQIIADSFWNLPHGDIVNTIAVSRKPCEDCCDFLARVELLHGLTFKFSLNGRIWTEGKDLSIYRVWLTSLVDCC